MKHDDNNDENDGLNSEEFSGYLGKYNDYFEKNKPNHSDLSFLDKPEQPDDDEVIALFVTPDDYAHSVDIANYDQSELGIPDAIKTLEGTEWRVSKLVWFKPEGRIISFALIRTDDSFDMRKFPWKQLGELQSKNEIIDIEHEEIEAPSYKTRLADALEDEDYIEAARLRDWAKKLNELITQAYNLSNNSDIDKSLEKLDEINEHITEL